MSSIAFIDFELETATGKVRDIGCFKEPDLEFHERSLSAFRSFIRASPYVCGHNIFNHDLKYVQKEIQSVCPDAHYIDTLYLAPLLFPAKPYHNLVKDDKLQVDELNNPLNDAKKSRILFYDEVSAFIELSLQHQNLFYQLLHHQKEFTAFFQFIEFKPDSISTIDIINRLFGNSICANTPLEMLIKQKPLALAYCLSLINAQDTYSIVPRWLSRQIPEISQVMHMLRSESCITGCQYCDDKLNIHKGLKRFFNFDEFKSFGGVPLQEQAVSAAIRDKSLLAIFPTGGGKSLTFQIPALMQGEANKGLTVIISPLQSLMKDQVDNLENAGIVTAATINGLLDPIERAESFERVEDGRVHILYLSPESLRSPSIERLLAGRTINRFVIDEAHCFSSWGQDFRVDYLYIGDFIKSIQKKKNLPDSIPVSCFTATAKPQVNEDIRQYFRDKLNIDLQLFQSDASRTNLHYIVYPEPDDTAKYNILRDILSDKSTPSIIYVSRTKKAEDIAGKLRADGYKACPYHGKLDPKTKTENQNAFIKGEVPIMVATSAFGMGVDKKDIQIVIHYEISDSLENYVQEAGRAGRDEKLKADCYILYNEDDLNKHFILQNSTRLTIKEINQVWKSIKDLSRFRLTISKSALDIARQAGWDETISEIETRVTTAVAALEEAGYLERKQNQSSVYADSIQSKTAQAAIDRIMKSTLFSIEEQGQARLIISKLVGKKRRSQANDEDGESRVDYLADTLGIPLEQVIHVITLLKQEGILADDKDLTAYIKEGENGNRPRQIASNFQFVIQYLLQNVMEVPGDFNLKKILKELHDQGHTKICLSDIRTCLVFLGIKNWIKYGFLDASKNIVRVGLSEPVEILEKKLNVILGLVPTVIEFLLKKSQEIQSGGKKEVLIGFSILDILEEIKRSNDLLNNSATAKDIEDLLFYLSKIDAISIEGGFLVIYKKLLIEKNEERKTERFKEGDYEKLKHFYEHKIQQVHIAGEYARKMIHDYQGALQFVDDYFKLNFSTFVNKYFPGSQKEEIKRTITPKKFQQLFGELSPPQLEIIKDQSRRIAVLAGPGSGKTRVLVHKLASIYLLEDIKHEQILMLTFSRSAVTEFKKRLRGLIGNAATYIEIKTFHSFCFDLLGKMGDIESSKNVIAEVLEEIKKETIVINKLTRLVLLVDEAQDINQEEFALIKELIRLNEELRVILVGDDDQNIFEFRGSSSRFLSEFIATNDAKKIELIDNYRSAKNLVAFTNRFATSIINRLKESSIVSMSPESGLVSMIIHSSPKMVVPVVNEIANAPLAGDTCVLTRTNEEASQIALLLKMKGMKAQLIQTNDGFSILDLLEVRRFLTLVKAEEMISISKETWDLAKQKFKTEFSKSLWLEMTMNLLNDYDRTNPKARYTTDLRSFISESRIEDFVHGTSETIWVSTFHKAKGKEFNNVYVLIEKGNEHSEEFKRTLYVAMTRAKTNLTFHINGTNLKKYTSEDIIIIQDNTSYEDPSHFAIQLSHEDVKLGHFSSVQKEISNLSSGDTLQLNEEGCKDQAGHFVIRFSEQFLKKIKYYKQKGYQLESAKVLFIVFWEKKDQNEILIVLPEVYFRK